MYNKLLDALISIVGDNEGINVTHNISKCTSKLVYKFFMILQTRWKVCYDDDDR